METIGELIEKLVIENIRIWHLMDEIASNPENEKVAISARQIVKCNKYRSALRAEVSMRLGEAELNIKQYGR